MPTHSDNHPSLPTHQYRKPLKLPRPCFPMARQCVKLRRINPPTLGKKEPSQGNPRGNLWKPVRGTFFLYSKPELGVLSCSTAVTEQRVASRPTSPHAIIYRLAHLDSKENSLVCTRGWRTALSGWVFLVCGSWYILYLRFCLSVCRKCCMQSSNQCQPQPRFQCQFSFISADTHSHIR